MGRREDSWGRYDFLGPAKYITALSVAFVVVSLIVIFSHGLNYGVLMRHEHVNTAKDIEGVLRFCFKKVRREVLGLMPALSFYQYFECSEPDVERCQGIFDRTR